MLSLLTPATSGVMPGLGEARIPACVWMGHPTAAGLLPPALIRAHPILLRLPQRSTADWAASPAEIYHLTVREAGSPRSRCGQAWFLLRDLREGSVPSLTHWLVGSVFLLAWCSPSVRVCV